MPAPITIKIGRDRLDRRINTRWHGEFLACHSPGGNDTVRGHWDVTFIPAGLRVCELKYRSKKQSNFVGRGMPALPRLAQTILRRGIGCLSLGKRFKLRSRLARSLRSRASGLREC